MAQESLRQRALYELRVFGIPFVRALEVAVKVRTVAAGLRSGVRPENAARLTFADLDLIARVDRAVARESSREVLEQAAALVALSNLTAIAGAVLEIHSLVTAHIAPRIYEGFRTGDALFYDLTNRQRAGLEMGAHGPPLLAEGLRPVQPQRPLCRRGRCLGAPPRPSDQGQATGMGGCRLPPPPPPRFCQDLHGLRTASTG
eukprot:TRINITY_DN14397_c0_g1_i1.p2 TRINITY_DN14397_c0_g1~~TRINITY_DN14397_c0_g1_i1.p2  ORF type:complete len:202 (-),score=25.19 TRINITY_DN14397_c0_g1_i1:757-1362(-)